MALLIRFPEKERVVFFRYFKEIHGVWTLLSQFARAAGVKITQDSPNRAHFDTSGVVNEARVREIVHSHCRDYAHQVHLTMLSQRIEALEKLLGYEYGPGDTEWKHRKIKK